MSDNSKTKTAVADTFPQQRDGDTGPLLKVRDLAKHFPIKGGFPIKRTVGHVKAVDGVDLEVYPGESLGLVGESGCGKSTTGRLLTRLYEPTHGTIEYKGQDISRANRRQLAPIRSEIQMIFQDPYASLNPRQTVATIISGPMEINGINPPGGREKRVRELLEIVGLNPEHYNRFPHEFSGGQRQRIGVARAVALEPKLIVADEPCLGPRRVDPGPGVNLLQEVQREMGIAFVFIAHDLAIVRHFSQRIAVMYLGKVVEIADRDSLYNRPRHPYTHALLSAVPEVDLDAEEAAHPARGRRSLADQPALRLPVPHPVLEGAGQVRHRGAAARADLREPRGPPDGLPLPGGGLTEARAEDIVLDPGLRAMEDDADGGAAVSKA
ncbi:dipeptide ABC transporter ATP-binding protein [Streptomyces violaceorubidus]